MPRRQHRAHRTPANDPFLIAASTPGHPLYGVCQDQRIRPEDAGEFLQMEKDRCNAGRVPYEYDDIVDQVIDETEAGMYGNVMQGGGHGGAGRRGGHGGQGEIEGCRAAAASSH